MALLYVVELKGNPKDLLAKYDQAGKAFEEKGRKLKAQSGGPKVIVHTCVETPDGIRISELLDGEALEKAAPGSGRNLEKGKSLEWLQGQGLVDDSQRQAVRGAGLLDVNYSESIYKVHNFVVVKG